MPDNVQMQGIEFEIKGDAKEATASLKETTKEVEKTGRAVEATAKAVEKASKSKIGKIIDSSSISAQVRKIDRELERSKKAVEKYYSDIEKIHKGKEAAVGKGGGIDLGELDKQEIALRDKISEYERIQDRLQEQRQKILESLGTQEPAGKTPVDSGVKEEIEKTGEKFDEATPKIKKYRDSVDETVPSHRRLSAVLSALRPRIDGVANVVGKLGKRLGSGVGKTLARPFIQMGNSVKNAVSKIGQLESSFKRILFYRAIRSIIKEIGQAFKEGTDNLYYYSQAVGTQFAQSMDQLATAFQYFKNSVGAAASPLINALAPAIDYVIDRAVALLNVLNQLFARLSGAAFWTRATKQAKQYGAAVGGAGGAAKEAMRYLAPFDELNVLPDNSSGGGGGGGGGGGYEDMFEEVAIDSALADFVDRIKAAINAGDWYGAGVILGDKINELIPSKEKFAEWGAKIGSGIQHGIDFALGTLRTIDFVKVGTGAAAFSNNLLENINPQDVGALLASKLRIAIDLAYGFVTEFKWDKFGDWLGEVVNGWFAEIDWKKAAKTISDGIIGLLTSLRHFLQTTDWKQIGLDIGTFLSEIDWGDVFGNIVGAIGDAAQAFLDLFNGWAEKMPILARLVEGVGIAFAGWKIGSGIYDAVSSITGLFGIGKGVKTAVSGASKAVSGASEVAKDASGVGGLKIPSIKSVLTGLGDIALIIFGVTGIVEAYGLLSSIPGFNEFANKGISALSKVFKGIASVGLELAGVSVGIVALGKLGIATVAKGLAGMAMIIDGVPAVITALGALMSIPGFQDFASTGISVMQKVFTGIGDVALQLAGTAGAIVLLGFASPGVAASGLAGFAIIVDGVALVIGSLGALAQIPGFEWLIGEGGRLLVKLGTILGEFAGSIIEGLLDKATEGFGKVAEHLSEFAQKIKPFVSAMSGITGETASSTKNLATAILELTSANLIDQLSTFFGGGDSWKTFGENLVSFSGYFVQYANKISEVSNFGVVTASANAAQALAELANNIPSQGGIVGWLWSQKDLSKFGEQIEAFGDAISKYAKKVTGLNGDVIQASANASQALVQLSNDIPSTGGVVGWFWDQKNIGQFGEQLVAFGEGIKNYYNSVKGINGDVVQKSADAASALVKLAQEIPSNGGILGWLWEQKSFETFGNQLEAFGSSMSRYAESVSGLNIEAMSKANVAAGSLIELANKAGSVDASKLVDFGVAVAQFGQNLSSVTWADVSADFTAGMAAILGSIESSVEGMKTAMTGLQGDLLSTWSAITSEASKGWDSVSRTIDQKTKDISANVTKKLTTIKNDISKAWTAINTLTSTAWGTTIKNTISSKWDQIIRVKTEKTNTFKNELSASWDSMNTIAGQKWDGIKGTILEKFGGIRSGLQSAWNDLYRWWSNLTLPAFNVRVPSFSMYGSFDPKTGRTPSINVSWNTYAQGGFPEDGLFFANHGELVGEFSNGKTAVANNEQIIEGIKAGVYEAVVDAFGRSDTRGGGDAPIIINLDGKQIAKTTTRVQHQMARANG